MWKNWFVAFLAIGLLIASSAALGAGTTTSDGRSAGPARIQVSSASRPGPEGLEVHLEPIARDERAGSTGADESIVKRIELVDGSAEIELSIDAGRQWMARVTAPGHWSAPTLVDPGESTSRIMIWPAAELEGKLELPRSSDVPRRIQIRLRPNPEGDEASGEPVQPSDSVDVTCPVEELKIPGCIIPAGDWHLRFSSPPFAPEFLWDRTVEPGGSLDVGTLELERGGSLTGQLRTEVGPLDPRRARIWLQHLAGAPPDPPRTQEDAQGEGLRFAIPGEIGSDGTFQFVGVREGTYELRATHPGFVTGTVAPVTINPGEWTDLRKPIVLQSPLSLSLTVDPVTEPFGEPWEVQLYRIERTGEHRLAAEGKTDGTGFWESPPLPGGKYEIWVLDAEGNTLATREIVLERGSEFFVLDLPLVYVEGDVLFDGRPLAAQIRLKGVNASEVVDVESDEEGKFSAVLPHEGRWQIDVAADSPPVRYSLTTEIEPIDTLKLAEVVIEIPDTALWGKVVDSLGNPPAVPARLMIVSTDGSARSTGTLTDRQGVFEIRGIPAGSYLVAAEIPEASSRAVTVEITEDRETSVTLVVEKGRIVVGRVLSDSGPVSGAQVRAHFLTGTGAIAARTLELHRTTTSGEVELRAPGDAIGVRLIAMAPGYGLGVARSSAEEDVEVLLEQDVGYLRLESVRDLLDPHEGPVGVLMVDGEAMDLHQLIEWAHMNDGGFTNDGTLSVPAMPPAVYQLCRMSFEEAVLVWDGAALPTSGACAEGILARGGDLRLAPPPVK